MEGIFMSNLIASAENKENLEKLINQYYYSNNYVITDNNEIFNNKKQLVLSGFKIVVNHNRWRFERIK
jgi:hypothetical protein